MWKKKRRKKPCGRPQSLTPELRETVLQTIRDGGSRKTAARLVGCHVTTITNTAENDPDFGDALSKAEADFEMFHLRRIASGDKAWTSSAWLLERKLYRQYAKRDNAPDDKPASTVRVRPLGEGNTRKPEEKPDPPEEPNNADSGSGN